MSQLKIFKKKNIHWKEIDWKEHIKTYSLIILGTFIMSIGYVIFISPLKLAPGGVYGIAIILHHLFNFPIGLSGLCLDLPLLLIGTLWLGPKFGVKTLVGVITLPSFISIWEKIYGYDPLICLPGQPGVADPSATFILALCGGVIIGLGLGLIFKTRATSGGTDIIAMIIGKYVKHIPLGTILIFVDSIVVIGALIAFKDWTIPLYSWLVIYVTGMVMDKVIAGFASNKVVLIISDRYEEIRQHIFDELDRGGTYIKGEGMYNNDEKKIIFTSISRKQLPILIHFVHKIDPKAFVSILDASETLGDGFMSLREKALN